MIHDSLISPEDDNTTPLTVSNTQIDTSGGTYVDGDTNVGRDFIGRDRVTIGQQIVVVMSGSTLGRK
jgi:hypothetical protein